MKLQCYFLVLLAVSFYSCNSDDSDNAIDDHTVGNYLPLSDGNYWTYNVNSTEFIGRDSVYVANDTMIGGSNYKKIKARELPYGLFAGTANNNGMRKENGKIFLSGNAAVGLEEIAPIDLTLINFVMLDENANENQLLGSVAGTSQQEIDGIPLNLSYTLRSTAGSTLATYTTPLGTVYQNVKAVTVTFNLAITATMEIPGLSFEVPVLVAQDVITSERFYADNIGMIYSKTVISYELQDFSSFNFNLPIPQSDTQIHYETLHSHQID